MYNLPQGLEKCDPYQRFFPPAWKQAYFRMNFDEKVKGYVCPACQQAFRAPKGFEELKCDHIHPFSKGGLTVWENLQLLCARCNIQKSNTV
ncbi:MAG: HNH endonuclease signature motif containing protein [Microcoleaceae cyanobacterium]